MVDQNQELFAAFSEEIKAIKKEVEPIFSSLKTNPSQPTLIEKFGQIIDRIYGTAATLGYKDLAEYTLSIKTMCYKCGQSNNVYAHGKAKDLIFVFYQNLDRLANSVQDKKLMSQMRKPFADEKEKADSLLKKILGTISRGTVA